MERQGNIGLILPRLR